MKFASKFLFVVCVLVIMASMPIPVHAAPAMQETQPTLPSLSDLFKTLENLGGIALLFAAGFNAAKKFGWLQDGQAQAASLIFNTCILVGLVVLQFAGHADLVPVIDQNAGMLSTILTSVVALVYQLFVARVGHENVLAGLPVVGYSHSGRQAGEHVVAELVSYPPDESLG